MALTRPVPGRLWRNSRCGWAWAKLHRWRLTAIRNICKNARDEFAWSELERLELVAKCRRRSGLVRWSGLVCRDSRSETILRKAPLVKTSGVFLLRTDGNRNNN